jgi:hypothetical protein
MCGAVTVTLLAPAFAQAKGEMSVDRKACSVAWSIEALTTVNRIQNVAVCTWPVPATLGGCGSNARRRGAAVGKTPRHVSPRRVKRGWGSLTRPPQAGFPKPEVANEHRVLLKVH